MGLLTFIDTIFQDSRTRSYIYKDYHSREEYYKNLLREDTENRLIELFSCQEDCDLNPEVKIQFRDVEFGSSLKEVLSKLGEPRFEINNQNSISEHQVFFYRFGFYHFKAVAQLHFLQGRFFYAKYTFRNSSATNFDNILTALKNKYFYTPQFRDKISRVKDTQGNTILLEKSLHLHVKYLSGDPSFSKQIEENLQKKLLREEKKQQQQLKALQDCL